MLKPIEVLELARGAEGMVAVFALIGCLVKTGEARLVFDALVHLHVPKADAWYIVDGWDGVERRQSLTGWTPEVAAMAVVMDRLATWRVIRWGDFANLLTAPARSCSR